MKRRRRPWTTFSLRSLFVSTAFAAVGFALFRAGAYLNQQPYSETVVLLWAATNLLAICVLGASVLTLVVSVIKQKRDH